MTIRYCDATARCYDALPACTAYRIGGAEPQGREVPLWQEDKGSDKEHFYCGNHLPLLTEEDIDLSHAVIVQGTPVRQIQPIPFPCDIVDSNAWYWASEPRKPHHAPKVLAFADRMAPRTHPWQPPAPPPLLCAENGGYPPVVHQRSRHYAVVENDDSVPK